MEQRSNNRSNLDECRITFIIGNGFDLNLGMKTRYADIYDSYVKTPSKTDVIAAFKQDLNIHQRYEKWADFEMGMAEYARSLQNEQEFVECIRDFKLHMVKHLERENEQIAERIFSPNFEPGIAFELENSLHYFHEGITPNVSKQIAKLWQNKRKCFGFLNFNYTSTISFVFSAAEEFLRLRCNLTDVQFDPEILHIHGSLKNDVVLGVDNERQLQCLPYPLSVRGKRAFIKPYFNEQYDARRILEAQKMIEDSEVVCIFGFSMGESDRMWIELLAEWLCRNANHHLIYYEYDEHLYAPCNYDEIMDAEEEKKQRLLKRLGLGSKDEIDKQVHIPIKEKIFAFDLKRGVKEFEQEVMENQRRYREYSRTK